MKYKPYIWCVLIVALGAVDTDALDRAEANMVMAPIGSSPFTPSCSQSGVVIARTSGENKPALDTMICGMVTDGLIDSTASMASTGGNPYCGTTSAFDRLFILAMANSTDGLIDICGHTSATTTGSPTFTANAGFTGGADGNTTVWIDTGFNPATGCVTCSQNSIHMMGWTFTSFQSSTNFAALIGNFTSSSMNIIIPWASSEIIADTNSTGTVMSGSISNSVGSTVTSRTGVNTGAIYRNGSAISLNQLEGNSLTPPSLNVFLLGQNSAGTVTQGGLYQMPAASIGKGLTAAQVSGGGGTTGLHPRICAYLTTVHGSC